MMKPKTFAAMLLASISMPTAALAQDAEVTVDLNMRVGPGTRFPIITTIPDGGDVEVYGCVSSFDWCDVSWSGWRGWVFADYLEYYYDGRWVPIVEYRSVIEVPEVRFVFEDYVYRYYRDEPFYNDLLVEFEFEFDDDDDRDWDDDRDRDRDWDDDRDRDDDDWDRGDDDDDRDRDRNGDRDRDRDRGDRDQDRNRDRDRDRNRDQNQGRDIIRRGPDTGPDMDMGRGMQGMDRGGMRDMDGRNMPCMEPGDC